MTDEMFMQTLRLERGESVKEPIEEQNDLVQTGAVRTVILLPLSDRQIRLFAERSGVRDAPALLAEIGRQHAWTFARRPLDLSELIDTWTSSGRLGTRAEQDEANIAAELKDNPDRPDCGVLTDAQTRLGAQRLALALALTRTRTIRSPEQEPDIERAEGVLHPATILLDWTDEERQSDLTPATGRRPPLQLHEVRCKACVNLPLLLEKRLVAQKTLDFKHPVHVGDLQRFSSNSL